MDKSNQEDRRPCTYKSWTFKCVGYHYQLTQSKLRIHERVEVPTKNSYSPRHEIRIRRCGQSVGLCRFRPYRRCGVHLRHYNIIGSIVVFRIDLIYYINVSNTILITHYRCLNSFQILKAIQHPACSAWTILPQFKEYSFLITSQCF